MKQQFFYTAFCIICDKLKELLNFSQKEAVFNLIFGDLYSFAGVEIFDYDQFRKITSGINQIHRKVLKKLLILSIILDTILSNKFQAVRGCDF